MQPYQLGIAGEVRYLFEVGCIVLGCKDPPHVTINEALAAGRMHVFLCVGMQMVMAVLRCPPKNAFLGAALREECEGELKYSAGGVGAVREVAVVSGRDREEPHPIERHANYDRLPGNP